MYQFSSIMSAQPCPTLRPHEVQHARLPGPSPPPGVCSNSCPLVSDTIQPSHAVSPLFLLPSIFPSIRVFSNESAFHIKGPKYWSFSINPSNDYYTWLVWSPCSPSDSQESSPAQHFESIIFSVLSLLHGPTLISVHSFDYTDVCQQADVSAF